MFCLRSLSIVKKTFSIDNAGVHFVALAYARRILLNFPREWSLSTFYLEFKLLKDGSHFIFDIAPVSKKNILFQKENSYKKNFSGTSTLSR